MVGYHKIYVETVWATEVDINDCEVVENTMNLKEYAGKRDESDLSMVKLHKNINKAIREDGYFNTVKKLNAKTRIETNKIEIKKGKKLK